MGLQIAAIVFIALHVALRLSRDHFKGVALGVFYLAWLPIDLRIPVPDFLPQVTVLRIIMVLMFASALTRKRLPKLFNELPFGWLVVALFGAELLSIPFALDLSDATKAAFATLFESVGVYTIVFGSLRNFEDCKTLLKFAAFGVTIAAAIAWMEYYHDFNPLQSLMPAHAVVNRGGVVSTYQHRIHTGYIMAMVAPVFIAAYLESYTRLAKLRYAVCFLLVVGACYFAKSRGPWIGMGLAWAAIFTFGGAMSRRFITCVASVSGAVFLLDGGVRTTLVYNLSSLDPNGTTAKEKSADYRIKLYQIAYKKVTKSPVRFLVGYGGLGTESMDLSGDFGPGGGGELISTGFSSWDSDYAEFWVDYGCVGIGLILILEGKVLLMMVRQRKSLLPQEQCWLAAAVAACIVYYFGQTNVSMFSPQLKYCLWSFIAVGLKFATSSIAQEALVPANASSSESSSARQFEKIPV